MTLQTTVGRRLWGNTLRRQLLKEGPILRGAEPLHFKGLYGAHFQGRSFCDLIFSGVKNV